MNLTRAALLLQISEGLNLPDWRKEITDAKIKKHYDKNLPNRKKVSKGIKPVSPGHVPYDWDYLSPEDKKAWKKKSIDRLNNA